MTSRFLSVCVALMLGMLFSVPTFAADQSDDEFEEPAPPPRPEVSERVVQYNLSGPRIGATFFPSGGPARSQFGWHTENQAAPGSRGPWFLVERVFLFGGMEANQFVPSGTVIFGMRTPSSFEFGVGPSVTVGGGRGFNTGIVVAVGQSFRAGGIRIPVNVALAIDPKGSDHRVSLVTGWAIRDNATNRPEKRRARTGRRAIIDLGEPQ